MFALLLLVCSSGIAVGAMDGTDGSEPSPPTEIESARTATSKTFQLPDGARETQIFVSPIHYRDAEGEWQPIEEGFQETSEGGIGNGDNAFDVALPENLDEEPVQLSTEEGWVSAELIGPDTKEAQLEDGAVSYESADGGTSFEYTTLPDGLKENIEIADASQPTSFSFDLSASGGLTPELIENGSVEFRNEEGEALFILPAPTMYDSAGMAPASAIHYELEPQGEGNWRLDVQVDAEWLSAPERTWPVTIDPTITIKDLTLDCAIGGKKGEAGWGACGSGGQKELPLAYKPDLNSAKDEWSRGLLRFSLKSIPADSYIASATFKANAPEAALNTSGVELRQTTKKWSTYANWLNYDFDPGHKTTYPWTTEGGDYSTEVSSLLTKDRGSAAGWWDFPLSAQMVEELAPQTKEEGRKIVESPLEFIAKLLDDKSRVCGAESCTQRRVSFESSAAVLSQNRPYLEVTYYTPAPAGSQVTSPTDGTRSAKRFKLAAKWNHQGVTGITFQYKTPTRWVDIPATKVTDQGGQTVKWPLAIEGGAHESPPVYWDAVGALGPGYVAKGNIRAILVGAIGADGYTPPVEVELNREIGGTKDAVASVGPGAVNLLTGNFTVARTDVSIPGFGSALE
ncbi:MAG TPA: hypothetical protein VLB12_02565, partial [Gemmatimonadales bacterium]|nr:hypothetical protein [Gemmatimonadales bacterium]